jgi:formate dehydrogenase
MEKKHTFCRICESGCGFVAEVEDNRIVDYYPDKEHPFSKGYACIKGRHMLEIQYHPKRLKFPLKKVNGQFERISWEQAIDEIGARLLEIKDKYGPHSIGAYMGNVLAYSYSAVLYSGAFMSFIGTRNKYGPGSQDCSNKFAHSRNFYGSSFSIIYPDLDTIDYFLAMGTNPLSSHFTFLNCSNPSAKLKEMEQRGCKIDWVNPRKTESAKAVGEHHFIKPNSDIYLLLGMINYILENGREDKKFIQAHSKGIERLKEIAKEFGGDLDKIAGVTGIPKQEIIGMTEKLLDASAKGGASVYGRVGTDRGPFATLRAWAMDVLNLITGNIDEKGNLFSLGFYNIARLSDLAESGGAEVPRSRIGNFPAVVSCLPAATMADEILTPGEDQIRAMLVLSGDPLINCPNARKMEKAFGNLDLLVSIDIFMNDTGTLADYVLPSSTFLERDEYSHFMAAYNSMAFMHHSMAVVESQDDVKDEWQIFNLLSERMGIPTLGDQPFEVLKMLFPGEDQSKFEKMRKSEKGIFLNEDQKASRNVLFPDNINLPDKLIPLVSEEYLPELGKLQKGGIPQDADFPLSLISGRKVETINSWIHVRGETNYCYMNPDDAKELGIEDGQTVQVSTRVGSLQIPAKITDDLMKGVIWIPHGWGRTVQDVPDMAVEKRGVNVNLITDDDWTKLEPFAGMVLLDGIPVRVEKA